MSSNDLGEEPKVDIVLGEAAGLAGLARGVKAGRDGAAKSSTLPPSSALAMVLLAETSFLPELMLRGSLNETRGLRLSGAGVSALDLDVGAGRMDAWALFVFELALRCRSLLLFSEPSSAVTERQFSSLSL